MRLAWDIDAFNATTVNVSATSAVVFEKTFKSSASSFDASASLIQVPNCQNPLYWITFGAEVPPYTPANISVCNTAIQIAKTQVNFSSSDIVIRSGVFKLQANTKVALCSTYPTLQLFWSAFRLDTLFSPLIAFFVARGSPKSGSPSLFQYPQVFVNEGGAWNASVNAFIAPYNGTYFFSISGGVKAPNTPQFQLQVNNVPIGRQQFGGSMQAGLDLSTRSVLVQLNASDSVNVYLSGQNVYSDTVSLASSFSGFYYSPVNCYQVCKCKDL